MSQFFQDRQPILVPVIDRVIESAPAQKLDDEYTARIKKATPLESCLATARDRVAEQRRSASTAHAPAAFAPATALSQERVAPRQPRATRSDVIVPPEGDVQLLELNTIPGMTPTSLLPKIAAGQGIDYPQLCERILLGASLQA